MYVSDIVSFGYRERSSPGEGRVYCTVYILV